MNLQRAGENNDMVISAGHTGKNRGFTLMEILVSVLVFSVISLVLASTLSIGIRCFRKVDAHISVQQLCKTSLDYIVNELRQGVVNHDTGTENKSTGYLGISPPVEPTAVLFPNRNIKTGDHLVFTQPDFERFNPASVNFNRTNPENYQIVKYYTDQGKSLYREVQSINSDGSLLSGAPVLLSDVQNGSMDLKVDYITRNKFSVTLTITETIDNEEVRYSSSATVSTLSE
jgi:prepilin-type N-terminal cleavage/methylation domain-containing protein